MVLPSNHARPWAVEIGVGPTGTPGSAGGIEAAGDPTPPPGVIAGAVVVVVVAAVVVVVAAGGVPPFPTCGEEFASAAQFVFAGAPFGDDFLLAGSWACVLCRGISLSFEKFPYLKWALA